MLDNLKVSAFGKFKMQSAKNAIESACSDCEDIEIVVDGDSMILIDEKFIDLLKDFFQQIHDHENPKLVRAFISRKDDSVILKFTPEQPRNKDNSSYDLHKIMSALEEYGAVLIVADDNGEPTYSINMPAENKANFS